MSTELNLIGGQMPTVNEGGRDIAVAGETAREQALVLAAYSVADRRPRSEANAINKLSSSLERFSFAEKARYAYPRGGTTVEGPSVNLAREIARLWGNIQYGIKVIQDDEETRTVSGWAIDLETNSMVANEASFKKLIYRKKEGWIAPDERDLRELTNKHGAIAVRNSLLQLFPRDIIDGALKQAKSTIAKGYKAGALDTKALISSFKKIGVTGEQIEKYCECPVTSLDADQFAELRGIYESITSGAAKKEEFFGKKEFAEGQMPEATEEAQAEPKNVTPPKEEKLTLTPTMISNLVKRAERVGISENDLINFVGSEFGCESLKELQSKDTNKINDWIDSHNDNLI
jgi:hypothetical protein